MSVSVTPRSTCRRSSWAARARSRSARLPMSRVGLALAGLCLLGAALAPALLRYFAPHYSTRSYLLGGYYSHASLAEFDAVLAAGLDSGRRFPPIYDPWGRPFTLANDGDPELVGATQLYPRGHDGRRVDLSKAWCLDVPPERGRALQADYVVISRSPSRWYLVQRGDSEFLVLSGGPDRVVGAGGDDLAIDWNRMLEAHCDSPTAQAEFFLMGCVRFARALALCAALGIVWATVWRTVPRSAKLRVEGLRVGALVGGWCAIAAYPYVYTHLGVWLEGNVYRVHALAGGASPSDFGALTSVVCTAVGVLALGAVGLRASLPTLEAVAERRPVSPNPAGRDRSASGTRRRARADRSSGTAAPGPRPRARRSAARPAPERRRTRTESASRGARRGSPPRARARPSTGPRSAPRRRRARA